MLPIQTIVVKKHHFDKYLYIVLSLFDLQFNQLTLERSEVKCDMACYFIWDFKSNKKTLQSFLYAFFGFNVNSVTSYRF